MRARNAAGARRGTSSRRKASLSCAASALNAWHSAQVSMWRSASAAAAAVQLAVQIGLRAQQLRAGHVRVSAIHVSFSMARARASRDITVPMGTAVTSAISR